MVIVEERDSSPVAAPAVQKVESKDVEMEDKDEKEEKPKFIVPKEALVPFANPLADEKQMKKLLKSVKKGIPRSLIFIARKSLRSRSQSRELGNFSRNRASIKNTKSRKHC